MSNHYSIGGTNIFTGSPKGASGNKITNTAQEVLDGADNNREKSIEPLVDAYNIKRARYNRLNSAWYKINDMAFMNKLAKEADRDLAHIQSFGDARAINEKWGNDYSRLAANADGTVNPEIMAYVEKVKSLANDKGYAIRAGENEKSVLRVIASQRVDYINKAHKGDVVGASFDLKKVIGSINTAKALGTLSEKVGKSMIDNNVDVFTDKVRQAIQLNYLTIQNTSGTDAANKMLESAEKIFDTKNGSAKSRKSYSDFKEFLKATPDVLKFYNTRKALENYVSTGGGNFLKLAQQGQLDNKKLIGILGKVKGGRGSSKGKSILRIIERNNASFKMSQMMADIAIHGTRSKYWSVITDTNGKNLPKAFKDIGVDNSTGEPIWLKNMMIQNWARFRSISNDKITQENEFYRSIQNMVRTGPEVKKGTDLLSRIEEQENLSIKIRGYRTVEEDTRNEALRVMTTPTSTQEGEDYRNKVQAKMGNYQSVHESYLNYQNKAPLSTNSAQAVANNSSVFRNIGLDAKNMQILERLKKSPEGSRALSNVQRYVLSFGSKETTTMANAMGISKDDLIKTMAADIVMDVATNSRGGLSILDVASNWNSTNGTISKKIQEHYEKRKEFLEETTHFMSNGTISVKKGDSFSESINELNQALKGDAGDTDFDKNASKEEANRALTKGEERNKYGSTLYLQQVFSSSSNPKLTRFLNKVFLGKDDNFIKSRNLFYKGIGELVGMDPTIISNNLSIRQVTKGGDYHILLKTSEGSISRLYSTEKNPDFKGSLKIAEEDMKEFLEHSKYFSLEGKRKYLMEIIRRSSQ